MTTSFDSQADLFGTPAADAAPALPEGWRYAADFISAADEAALLATIATMPLQEARYKAWTAKRRTANFGTAYDYDTHELLARTEVPESLHGLRTRAAAWVGLPDDAFSSALVAEYRPGTPLGWHRDVPDFEIVFGLSLGTACRMRFRRYPPVAPKKADVLSIELAPRSAYVLRGPARWEWQHSIAPTPSLRWSITFRTRRSARLPRPTA